MKIRGLRWWVMALTTLVTVINILDRSTLNYMWNDEIDPSTGVVLQPGIATDLGLVSDRTLTAEERLLPEERQQAILAAYRADASKEILAYTYIFFMIAYGLSQILFGKLFDRIGIRRGFALSAFVWGWAITLTAFARGLRSLTFFRVMLGIGEAGPWPGTVKVNAEWFPLKERATAQGAFGAASAVGNIISPILISLLFLNFGWKVSFLALGIVCLLWIIPWWVVVRCGPGEHPWITDEERQYIFAGQPREPVADDRTLPLGRLLTMRSSYAVILSRFFLDPVWWIFMTWLPIYLKEVYGLGLEQIAATAWIPFLGAAVGGIAGGWLSGWLIDRGHTLNYARRMTIAVGCLMMIPGMIGAAFAQSALAASVVLIPVLGGFQFAIVNIQTLPSDLHAGKTVGSLAGLGGAAAVLGTVIMMYLVPRLTAGGHWIPLFVVGVLLIPLALLSVFLLAGHIGRKTETE